MLTKKQITETSWIILNAGTPYGYMRVENDKYIILIGADRHEFETYKDVETEYGKIKTAINKNKAKVEVGGFPTKHDKATPVQVESHPDLPTYTANGKAVFVAGFVAIKYAETKFWQVGNCVKLVTIDTNTFHGPFRTRLEAMHHVKEENRKANV